MKTNVVLSSKDRELLGFRIPVMSQDGFISITDTMKSVNAKRKSMGLSEKHLDKVLGTKAVNDRIIEMAKKLYDKKSWGGIFLSLQKGTIKIENLSDLRKLGLARRKGKGEGQTWFVDPYLYVLLALELDPEIYANVIIWLTDGLIKNRNDAGDAYIRMSAALWELLGHPNDFKDYISKVAEAINWIVFNEHYEGRRNHASMDELSDIVALENLVGMNIEEEIFKSFDDVIKFLRGRYARKWMPGLKKIDKQYRK